MAAIEALRIDLAGNGDPLMEAYIQARSRSTKSPLPAIAIPAVNSIL